MGNESIEHDIVRSDAKQDGATQSEIKPNDTRKDEMFEFVYMYNYVIFDQHPSFDHILIQDMHSTVGNKILIQSNPCHFISLHFISLHSLSPYSTSVHQISISF
jgi:hypothetical protein